MIPNSVLSWHTRDIRDTSWAVSQRGAKYDEWLFGQCAKKWERSGSPGSRGTRIPASGGCWVGRVPRTTGGRFSWRRHVGCGVIHGKAHAWGAFLEVGRPRRWPHGGSRLDDRCAHRDGGLPACCFSSEGMPALVSRVCCAWSPTRDGPPQRAVRAKSTLACAIPQFEGHTGPRAPTLPLPRLALPPLAEALAPSPDGA